MGIYDREYYRREGPSFLGSFTARGHVCKWLILVNIIVFLLQFALSDRGGANWFEDLLLLNTEAVRDGQVWRLLTYAFLHSTHTWTHIVFNMLFLWWFGSDVEDLYGHREFLAFYLVSAVVGGLAFQCAWAANMGSNFCLGASGAVTAVMVLFALHYPTRVIYLWFFLPIPIWLFVAFQVLQDTIGFLGGGNGMTAFSVHLGGAAFALVYYKMQWRLMSLWTGLRSWKQERSRPRLRVYREEETPHQQPVPVAAPPSADVDEQLEAKLDAVLEKVARSGQGSLTDSERQILLRASEIYKRRRS